MSRLGQLYSLGVKELQRGHICHERTPSLLSINSPFSDGDSGRSLDPILFVYSHTEEIHRCELSYVHAQEHKVFFPVTHPQMISALPSSSLESYRHKAEITSPSSNQGEREKDSSLTHTNTNRRVLIETNDKMKAAGKNSALSGWNGREQRGINRYFLFPSPVFSSRTFTNMNPNPAHHHFLRILFLFFFWSCFGLLGTPYTSHITSGKLEPRGAHTYCYTSVHKHRTHTTYAAVKSHTYMHRELFTCMAFTVIDRTA